MKIVFYGARDYDHLYFDLLAADPDELAAAGADLLCMDSTYPGDEDLDKAKLYGHATCAETGRLAAQAGVRRLWLTHYSAAVTDTAPGLAAARQYLAGAEAGFDGKTLDLNYDPD